MGNPFQTQIRPSLLLPPDARLRFTLRKDSQNLLTQKIWGLREAMLDATLLFTAWDGSNVMETGTSKEMENLINVSLPFCSNGVSINLCFGEQFSMHSFLCL